MSFLSAELLTRKRAKAIPGLVVRTEGLLVRIRGIGGDFLRDCPHLVRERLVVRRILQQRVDPALGAVVVGHIVVEEQLAEQRGRSGCRRRCGTGGCGAATRRASRSPGSRPRSAGRSSRSARRPAGSRGRRLRPRRELWLLSRSPATRSAPRSRSAAPQRASEVRARAAIRRPGRRRPWLRSTQRRSRGRDASERCRSCCWRQTPTITVGMIASSDVASACSCVRPSHVSVGTNRMPPPTPNRPASTPANRPSTTASAYVTAAASESRFRRGAPRRGTRACAPAAAAATSRLRPHRPLRGSRRAVRTTARTSPCATYVTTPAVAVIPIAASEVADAGRRSQRSTSRSSGTITIPPPTPNSALKKPARSPIRTRGISTGLCYEGGRDAIGCSRP